MNFERRVYNTQRQTRWRAREEIDTHTHSHAVYGRNRIANKLYFALQPHEQIQQKSAVRQQLNEYEMKRDREDERTQQTKIEVVRA